jgi:hypothetical protein
MPTSFDRFKHTFLAPLPIASATLGVATAGTAATIFSSAPTVAAATGLLTATVVHGALIVGTGGLALFGLPLAYCLAKGTFWRKRRQSYYKNRKSLSTDDFDNHMDWDCYWITIVVLGYTRTGKTQLKKRLRKMGELKGAPCRTTDNMEIHLSCVDFEKKAYIALLDSAGATKRESIQQADLITIAGEKARLAILVLDHTNTENAFNKTVANRSRLKEQEDFINQSLIPNLKRYSSDKSCPLKEIMVVMNKADLWEGEASDKDIRTWTEDRVKDLKRELQFLQSRPYFLSVEEEDDPGFAVFKEALTRLCQQKA